MSEADKVVVADGGKAAVADGAAAAADGATATSGHTLSQKALFSVSIISPLACGAVAFFAKDVYILQMGADVQLMGVFGIVLAVWGPCCYPIVGYLMERDLLVRFFPWESWGRRAPWFLINSFVMAVATAAVYVPPSLHPHFLCWWFLLCGSVNCWALSVLFTCFEATRAELYPTKEERGEVEAIVKVSAGIGTGLGLSPQLFIVAGATLEVRVAASAFFLVLALVSLLSLPALRMARQEYDGAKVSSFVREFVSFISVPANRHYSLYKLFEAALYTVSMQAALYYLMLIDGLRGERLSMFIAAIGVVAGVATVAVLPLWAQFFRRRRSVNTNVVCGCVCALGALAPILLTAGDVAPAPTAFILYTALAQMTLNGQTYWRCVALGWLVDEDCLACDGRRREAVFVGSVNLVSSIGRAAAVGLVINGLASVGLDMTNCLQFCAGELDEAACVEACDVANVVRQPVAVRTYTRVLYYAVVPALQLACAALTASFPIHGARLDRIYATQAARFAPASLGKAAPPEAPEAEGAAPTVTVARPNGRGPSAPE